MKTEICKTVLKTKKDKATKKDYEDAFYKLKSGDVLNSEDLSYAFQHFKDYVFLNDLHLFGDCYIKFGCVLKIKDKQFYTSFLFNCVDESATNEPYDVAPLKEVSTVKKEKRQFDVDEMHIIGKDPNSEPLAYYSVSNKLLHLDTPIGELKNAQLFTIPL